MYLTRLILKGIEYITTGMAEYAWWALTCNCMGEITVC